MKKILFLVAVVVVNMSAAEVHRDERNYIGLSNCILISNYSMLNLKVMEELSHGKKSAVEYYVKLHAPSGKVTTVVGTKQQVKRVVKTYQKCNED